MVEKIWITSEQKIKTYSCIYDIFNYTYLIYY